MEPLSLGLGESQMTARSLVYLSYSGKDVQVAETKYAILSAFRLIRPGDDMASRCTDRSELHADLPVEVWPIRA